MSGGRGRNEGSLLHLIALLLSMRDDPITNQFDRVLADAERGGQIDPPLARTLRWWQRQSLQGQADFFAEVLPRILSALAKADDVTELGLEQARLAWETAEPSAAGLGGSAVAPAARPLAQPPIPAPDSDSSPLADRESIPSDRGSAQPPQTSVSASGVVSRRLLIAGLTVKAVPDPPRTPATPDTAPEPPPP